MIRTIRVGDRAGIVAAVACALHCLAFPMIAASMQVANVLTSDRTESVVIAVSLLISATTVVASCARRGAHRAVWGAFCIGARPLLSARLGLATLVEQPLVVVGAGLVIAAHVINLSTCPCRKDGSRCAIDD